MRRARAATVGAATLAMAASGPGQSFGLAVFTDPLMAAGDIDRSAFSVLYGIATLCSAALALAAGRVLDRVGPRAVWTVATIGLAASLALLSVDAGLVGFVPALCAARAFGQGTLPLIATVIVARGFDRGRSAAMAIAVQGLTVSGLLLPILTTAMSQELGWRAALRGMSLALILVVLPLGLALLGAAPLARAATSLPAGQGDRAVPRTGVRLLAATLAVPALVTTAIVVHATAIGREAGATAGVAATAIAAVAAGSAAGVLAGGWLGGRWSPGRLLAGITVAVTLGSLLVATGSPPSLLAGYAACGAAGGLVVTASVSLWARTYGMEGFGGLQGTASAAQISGAALGPLVPALSSSLTGSFTAGLVTLAALGVLAAIAGRRWVSLTRDLRASAPAVAVASA